MEAAPLSRLQKLLFPFVRAWLTDNMDDMDDMDDALRFSSLSGVVPHGAKSDKFLIGCKTEFPVLVPNPPCALQPQQIM